MEVIVRKTTGDAVNLTAQLIADAICAKPRFNLGLATGGTMEAVYARIAALNAEKKVSFAKVTTFNLDEYIGLPPEDVNSYRYYMNFHLFDHVDINKKNTHLPDGMAKDEEAEGIRYEKAIKKAGGLDLQLLGIGHDGHIGFNEPMSSLTGRTRSKCLTPNTLEVNGKYFNPPESMPKRAFTMGVGTILDARSIIMLITGASKADIAAQALEGPLCSMVTGSAVQLHRNAVVILDEAAAAKLTLKDYYNFIWENEPKWDKYRHF